MTTMLDMETGNAAFIDKEGCIACKTWVVVFCII